MASELISAYGANWPADYVPLQIEMGCIRKGGKWTSKAGKECGLGLSHHYEAMRHILWPELDNHRWNALCRDEILKNKVTVLLGCKSSGKTHTAAWMYLCEYLCFPEETCVLVASTHIEGLRLRVWAEITMLWQRAADEYDFIPGNLLDSKLLISTDRLSEDQYDERRVRDWRKGIKGVPCMQNNKFVGMAKFVGLKQKRVRLIADECFPAGTKIDTPLGPRPIETLLPGEKVFGAAGIVTIKAAMRHRAKQLVRITMKDGRNIVVTPNHPFFTQKGWIPAGQLNQSHYMLSTNETMSILREGISASEEQSRMFGVPYKIYKANLQGMREGVPKTLCEFQKNILFRVLFVEMVVKAARVQSEILLCRASQENFRSIIKENVRPPGVRGSVPPAISQQSAHEKSTNQRENDSFTEKRRSQAVHPGREWNGSNKSGSEAQISHSRITIERDCENQHESGFGVPSPLQTRLGNSRAEIRCGGGRKFSPDDSEEGPGCKEGGISQGSWVDSVENIQQADIERLGGGTSGIDVYNFQIEEHPSYSVNGFLAHNCQMMGMSFLSAFSNLDGNEDFRAIVLGNPNDMLDPLGKSAEPIDGWANHMEPKKTEVWKTRFMNGTCVNLVGTDSPNFDFPADQPTRYKYLISREKIANTASFFRTDSVEFYSQCVGVMKIGQMSKRVITRDICRQFRASEDVVWKGTGTTRIYALDAAYGGDRCVGGWGEFGQDITDKVILYVHPPKIIQISINGTIPEDQIAAQVKMACEAQFIAPENMGHDSTGRGSLGTAIARVWSAQTNPIEFGGSPTDRPVSLDMFVIDPKTKQRRLKTCKEHYRKFVTELWFSVRYAIEAGLIRGLTEEMIDEGCSREWRLVEGDRYEVETKEEMKERTGRSPDLFDFLSVLVEMARRRGFTIPKLANAEYDTPTNEWLDKFRQQERKNIRSGKLDYAA